MGDHDVNGESTPPNRPTTDSRNSWRHRFAVWLWGYDYFISYHWNSGGVYAVALAEMLRVQGYDVFLDRAEFAMGDDWKKIGERALKNTQRFILIATFEAVTQSTAVKDEVELFTNRGRQVVPIVFFSGEPGRLSSTLEGVDPSVYSVLRRMPDSKLSLRDHVQSLKKGPMNDVVRDLIRTYSVVRRRNVRALIVMGLAFCLTGFAAFATASWANAILARITAEAAADRESKARTRADQERARAEQNERLAIQRAKESDSRRLALLSGELHLNRRYDAAFLVAAKAFEISRTPEAKDALYNRLNAAPPLRAFLHGHDRPISALAFSPSGRLLASGDWNGNVVVWAVDGFRAEAIAEIKAPASISGIAFSPKDERFWVSVESGEIRMYHLATKELLWSAQAIEPREDKQKPLIPFSFEVTSLLPPRLGNAALRPDGKVIASGDGRGGIRFWDAEKGLPLDGPKTWEFPLGDPSAPTEKRPTGQMTGPFQLSYTPDSKTLIATGPVIVQFDPSTGKGTLIDQTDSSLAKSALSSDGHLLAYGKVRKRDVLNSESYLQLLFLGTGSSVVEKKIVPSSGAGHGLALSPDGKTLVRGGDDGRIEAWDVTGFEPALRARYAAHGQTVDIVAFAPNGTTLVSADWDGKIALWDARDVPEDMGGCTLQRRVETSAASRSDFLVVDPRGPSLIVVDTRSLEARLVRFGPSGPVESRRTALPARFRVECIALSRDGGTLALNDGAGEIKLLDVPSCELKLFKPGEGMQLFADCMLFSPRGDRLLIAKGSHFILLDVASGRKQEFDLPVVISNTSALAFDEGGESFASTDGHMVWRWEKVGSNPREYPRAVEGRSRFLPPITLQTIFFQPGGELLGFGLDKAMPALWDADADRFAQIQYHSWGTHTRCALAITRDGRTAAAPDAFGIRLWDMIRRRPWGPPMLGHSASIREVEFLPNEKGLASASEPRTINTLTKPNAYISADKSDRTLLLWNLDFDEWAETARRIANRSLSDAEKRDFSISE
jgi:WD40 repeat protein